MGIINVNNLWLFFVSLLLQYYYKMHCTIDIGELYIIGRYRYTVLKPYFAGARCAQNVHTHTLYVVMLLHMSKHVNAVQKRWGIKLISPKKGGKGNGKSGPW